MNSCIMSICIIIRAIALQKDLATATKYSRSNMHEEKAINAKSDQISYNMHSADFQGYRFCTLRNIPFNVCSFFESTILVYEQLFSFYFLDALNIVILLTLNK